MGLRKKKNQSAYNCIYFLAMIATACTYNADVPRGVTHALLINGGSQPRSNYQSHLHHLQDMVEFLEWRGLPRERIHIFSADGDNDAPDLAVRDTLPSEFWLIEGTRVGRRLRPRTELKNTRWEGVTLYPARRAALRKWFETARRELVPGDRLLIFVTDHGTGNRSNPDNGAISLWQEKLSVEELKLLLKRLRSGVRTVMIMSQCYSGTFAGAIYDGVAEPTGDVCGFFSTTRDLQAYGCYPEGSDRDRIGHAFHFIEALDRHETTLGAHLEVLVTDKTPDVPLRTSDVYLERLVAAEAEVRGLEIDALVDQLLAEAWQDRAAWEPEIRLLDRIGDAFGTFSPRSLAELKAYADRLPPLIEQMKTYAERWQETLKSVKEENLKSFVNERTEWRAQLKEKNLKTLDVEDRKELLTELLIHLEWYILDRSEMWLRLEDLRDRAGRASEARWRLEIRQAALLRMREILVGIGGRVLLKQETLMQKLGFTRRAAQREAYKRLVSCEALEPGQLPALHPASQEPAVEPFPPLADELRLMEEILPSWLGARYRSVPKALQSGRRLPAGASRLEAVYPDSPATQAGLEVGDIILGPPGRPFENPGGLREWTMTSPRDSSLQLSVLRPGPRAEMDEEFEATLFLHPYPLDWPKMPGPPKVGHVAPALPSGLKPVDSEEIPDLFGRPHLLFFWATWCLPCKRAVPEVMAFAAAKGIAVLAISDEGAATVTGYLDTRQEPFFARVAVDPLRRSFIAYGVSGTPTIVLVDDKGVVRHRQVGYKAGDGLTVEGWRWAPGTSSP
jgi:thiol-disulfide isomerase/thioredoxin